MHLRTKGQRIVCVSRVLCLSTITCKPKLKQYFKISNKKLISQLEIFQGQEIKNKQMDSILSQKC